MNRPSARMSSIRGLVVATVLALLSACASTPQRPPELVRLQNELSRLQSDPMIAGNAGNELGQARHAIDIIASEGRRMDADLFDHNVYVANRLLQIAEAEGRANGARLRSEQLAADRERLVADARSREADRARFDADQARRQAQMARSDANSARAELRSLRDMLTDLQARPTDRGLVVTLGDVLFETDRAEIKPGAQRNLDQLVAALREHPQSTVAIEGHTDSVGGASYNMDLSQRRADSVASYLASNGIDRTRLRTAGLGQDFPVASNNESSGRQQNRRVEIIIQETLAQRY